MVRIGLLLSFFVVAGVARAQDEALHFGARASGMGGAFTAVASDATAFYWNPAGYKFGPIAEAGLFWGEAGEDRAIGVATGFTFMGLSASSLRQAVATDSGPRTLETFDVSVSILQSLPLDDLVVATNLHYLRVGLDDLERSGELTLDVSALYEPVPWFRAGVMWRRLNEPRIDLPSAAGASSFTLERHARAGVAFFLPGTTVVAFDVDVSRQRYGREVSLGVEKAFRKRAFAVRLGVRGDQGSVLGARPTVSVGVGGRIRWFMLDAAYETSAEQRDDRLFFGVALSR